MLGMKFNGGVVIAADKLGSYGSLARFKNLSRIMKINESTVIGAGGDYADFQHLTEVIEQKVYVSLFKNWNLQQYSLCC